ncbi:hypothetical protein TSUD_128220, partial [Trifolium subterraneum]
DTVHASFVVLSTTDSTWPLSQEGLDVTVKGPSGDQVRDFHGKVSEKFDFVARTRGPYRFCFTNKSPYREKIDFDVHSNHFSTFDQHAQDVNNAMSSRAIHKALLESAALIGASTLQVYLLRRLFERKLGL